VAATGGVLGTTHLYLWRTSATAQVASPVRVVFGKVVKPLRFTHKLAVYASADELAVDANRDAARAATSPGAFEPFNTLF